MKTLGYSQFLLLLVMPLLASRASATTIITMDATLSGAETNFEVQNGPGNTITTVVLEDPAVVDVNMDGRSAGLLGSSILNMTGGTAQGDITLNDTSTLNMTGGLVQGSILLEGDSMATLSGSSVIDGAVVADGNSTLVLQDNVEISLDEEEDVEITGNAHADFLGGEVYVFAVTGNATATVDGGSIDDDFDVEDDAVVNVLDVFVNDDIDTADNGILNIMGGLFDEDIEAADDSTINISGGNFPRVFSGDDGDLIAGGGTINITGGVFGEAGVDGETTLLAVSGGTVNIPNGMEIAGSDTDTAPAIRLGAAGGTIVGNGIKPKSNATLSSQVLGKLELEDVEFDDISITSSLLGEIELTQLNADNVTAELTAGDLFIEEGTVADVDVSVDGGTLVVKELTATSIDVSLLTSDSSAFIGGNVPGAPGTGESGFLLVEGGDLTIAGLPDSFVFNFSSVQPGLIPGAIGGVLDGVSANGTPFSYIISIPPAGGGTLTLVGVPEPNSLALIGVFGIASTMLLRRRRL